MLNCIGNRVEQEVYGELGKTSNAGTAIGFGIGSVQRADRPTDESA